MSYFKKNIDIFLILLLGFVLRFTGSIIHSYSNDELSAVTRLRFENFSDLMEYGVKTGDMHPAGVQVFMKFWSFVAGTDEGPMRFPFVIFGVCSIFMIFKIGNEWFNRKVGLYAAALLAVLYFPIMNSEYARPYSPGLLLALLVGYYIYKVLFIQKSKWKNSMLLGILFALGMYTHYFSFLFVGFVGITGLFFINHNNWKPLVAAGLVGILLFLPHYAITDYHLNVGGLQWLAPPSGTWLFEFLFFAFNSSWVFIILLLVALSFGLFIRGDETRFKKSPIILSTLWFFGTFVVGFVLSYLSTPVLKFPVMLFAFPYLLLLIGIGLSGLPKTKIVIVAILLVGTTSTIVERNLFGNQHYALFKEVGIKIAEWNEEYGEENIHRIYNLNNPDYINFYKEEWGGKPIVFDRWELGFSSDVEIRRDLSKAPEEYCIIGYSSRVTTVQIYETVRSFYPEIVDYWNFENGAVFLLKRGAYNEIAEENFITSMGKNETGWESSPYFWTTTYNHDAYLLNEENLYGPTYHFKLTDIPNYDDGYLMVKVTAHLDVHAGLTVTFSGKRKGEFILNPNTKENMWLGHDLEEMIFESSENIGFFAFKVPDYVKKDDALQISLWNRNGTIIRIDSIRIISIENIFNS